MSIYNYSLLGKLTFWTFWIIALHLLYNLWISKILATSITEETCIVEMRIWCKKIGTVNFIIYKHRLHILCSFLESYYMNNWSLNFTSTQQKVYWHETILAHICKLICMVDLFVLPRYVSKRIHLLSSFVWDQI